MLSSNFCNYEKLLSKKWSIIIILNNDIIFIPSRCIWGILDVIFQFVQQTSLQKLIMAIFANLEKCKNQIQDTSSSSKSSQLNWNDRLFDFNLNPLFYFSFYSSDHSSDLPTLQILLLFKPYSSTILLLPRASSSTHMNFKQT